MKIIFKIILLTLFAITASVGLYSCEQNGESQTASQDVYTCPMHPSVRSDRPAACPLCGMDLVKITQMPSSDTAGAENVISIMPRQQVLANVKTLRVKVSEISADNMLLGKVTEDPRSSITLTSKVPGRIERLFIRNPLEKVKAGQPIYEIYSEELLVDQKEYILSLQKLKAEPDNATMQLMVESSKNKLLQWGMSQSQVNQLQKTNSASARSTYFSPGEGILQGLQIREGQYVEIGSSIATLVKLNKVWVEAQVYPNELNILQDNANVFIEAENISEPLLGKMVFQNPSIDEGSRVSLTRFEVENTGQKLQPGMMVYVMLNSAGKKSIVIPKSAIMPEKMPTVYVKIGEESFEKRMVQLGTQNRYYTEVISGLKVGERVVVSGAYLIHSEYVLKKGSTQKHNH